MKINVEVQETLIRVVEVEAKDFQEARDKVEEAYHNEKIVLSPNDFVSVEFVYNNALDVEPTQIIK